MLSVYKAYIDKYWYREEGATAVEYGLMVALIAVVIIGAVIVLGENLDETFDYVGSRIGEAGSD